MAAKEKEKRLRNPNANLFFLKKRGRDKNGHYVASGLLKPIKVELGNKIGQKYTKNFKKNVNKISVKSET